MRSYLTDYVLPNIPSFVSEAIIPVTKYSYDVGSGTSITSTDSVWIPSSREVGLSGESSDVTTYSTLFFNESSRIKYNTAGYTSGWWLRTAEGTGFRCINSGGYNSSGNSTSNQGIALRFCL
jgi:hypothetical protein